MKNNKQKGFTLVELLVVIAILAILATVSVVGYTSFIKSAEISNDQNLASQLNNFLVALKADSNGDFYNADVTPENVWAVTDEIRDLGGLDEIIPTAIKYGHLYFRFDKDQNGNYVGGEYVFVEDGDVINKSGMHYLMKALADDIPLKPGFFEDDDENLYFLIDTAGSDIADVVRGFYTLDNYDSFKTFFNEAINMSGDYSNVAYWADQTVFVTADGSYVNNLDINHSNLVVYDDVTVITNTKFDLNGEKEIIDDNNPLISTSDKLSVTLPNNVTLYGDSLNIEVNDGATVTIKIDAKNWDEAKANIDANFTNSDVVVELGGTKYEVHKNKVYTLGNSDGAYTTVLKYKNPLDKIDVEFKNDATDDEIYNTTIDKVVGENTITVNLGYLGWRTNSPFYLTLDDNVTGVNADEAISTYEVEWTLGNVAWSDDTNDRGAAKKQGKTDADYIKVDPTTGKITLVAVDGYAPKIDSFEVVATAVVSKNGYPAGEHPDANATYEYANITFTVNVVRITNAALQLANDNWDIDIGASFVYEAPVAGKPTPNNTCSVGIKTNTETEAKELSYNHESIVNDGKIVLTDTFDINIPESIKDKISVANGKFTAKGAVNNQKLTVKIGEYITIDTALTVYDISDFPVVPKFDNIAFVGSLNELTINELFKLKSDTSVVPTGAQIKIYTETGDAGYMDWTGKFLYEDVYLKNNSGEWNVDGYEFDWNLSEDFKFDGNSGTQKVHIALFHNGVRISKDVEVLVVDATNINSYSELVANMNNKVLKSNVVLLDNIKIEPTSDTNSDKVINASDSISVNAFQIPAGTTFYGNYFDFDIKQGALINIYGIITLYGRMQDVRVLGQTYPAVALSGGDQYGSNAVDAYKGAEISNCYIANTRAPLIVHGGTGSVKLHNSVLFGGRYCNVDLRSGELLIQGTVTTIQQQYTADDNESVKNIIGIGIVAWFGDEAKTVTVDSATNGNLIQHNFVDPTVASSLPDLKKSDITLLELKKPFETLFDAKYDDYQFVAGYDNDGNPILYVNSAIIAADKYSFNYKTSGIKSAAGDVVAELRKNGLSLGLLRPLLSMMTGGNLMKKNDAISIIISLPDGYETGSFIIEYPDYYTETKGVAGDGKINITWDATTKQPVSDGAAWTYDATNEELTVTLYCRYNSVSISPLGFYNYTSYDFNVYSEKYITLNTNVESALSYGNTVYDYSLETSFSLAHSAGIDLHDSGLHYNKMAVDVYTLVPNQTVDSTTEKVTVFDQRLLDYIAIRDNKYYTPEKYFFVDGTLPVYTAPSN